MSSNIEPLILVQKSKPISAEIALKKLSAFTNLHSNESASSILSKEKRLSKPSDDVMEKLRTMVASMKEEKQSYAAESKKLIEMKATVSKRKIDISAAQSEVKSPTSSSKKKSKR